MRSLIGVRSRAGSHHGREFLIQLTKIAACRAAALASVACLDCRAAVAAFASVIAAKTPRSLLIARLAGDLLRHDSGWRREYRLVVAPRNSRDVEVQRRAGAVDFVLAAGPARTNADRAGLDQRDLGRSRLNSRRWSLWRATEATSKKPSRSISTGRLNDADADRPASGDN